MAMTVGRQGKRGEGYQWSKFWVRLRPKMPVYEPPRLRNVVAPSFSP